VVSGSDDKTVKIFDVMTRQCIKTIENNSKIWALDVVSDGSLIVTGSTDDQFRLFGDEYDL
jgi:WD40 repeat protein